MNFILTCPLHVVLPDEDLLSLFYDHADYSFESLIYALVRPSAIKDSLVSLQELIEDDYEENDSKLIGLTHKIEFSMKLLDTLENNPKIFIDIA